jgi:hypothetical protein
MLVWSARSAPLLNVYITCANYALNTKNGLAPTAAHDERVRNHIYRFLAFVLPLPAAGAGALVGCGRFLVASQQAF